MPIISKIGRRSFKVRFIYSLIFAVLIIGAVSMVYPFMLMLAGSMHSETDKNDITPIPKYWFSDAKLFQKYVESKYNNSIGVVEGMWHSPQKALHKIERPEDVDPELLQDYLDWRKTCPIWHLGHTSGGDMLPANARLFRKQMTEEYDEDLARFTREMDSPIRSWSELQAPKQAIFRIPLETTVVKDGKQELNLYGKFRKFAEERPIRDRQIVNIDASFWRGFLALKYGRVDLQNYNKLHGTNIKSVDELLLPRRIPPKEGDPKRDLRRTDWEEYVRDLVSVAVIRLDKELKPAYQKFLADRYEKIEEYNRNHPGNYTSFDQIPFSTVLPEHKIARVDWVDFLKDRKACSIENVEIYGPRQMFEEYVAQKRGVPVAKVTPLQMPIAQADWVDCMANTRELRWEFATRNYKQVLDFLLLHGKGVRNTVIYCGLAVLTALIVNPLAAYALSRYNPPSTYKILLLCMATMAFPNEVTMIPAFLLLKKFPLWMMLGGGAGFAVAIWLISKVFKNVPETIRMAIAVGIGVFVGWYLVPQLTGKSDVSLLNTFAALILPGMANGYSIFLLKGFFDSLPRELYEAADLDGASEWTKFWQFTMNLSKPILAVIALQSFTLAYSNFMMALIIIPDQDMWTLMVWIFQLQSTAHTTVQYASLVIAAIPTFLIFVLCQGVIMRGIVVPVEK